MVGMVGVLGVASFHFRFGFSLVEFGDTRFLLFFHFALGLGFPSYRSDSSVEAVKAHVYITVMISKGRILR